MCSHIARTSDCLHFIRALPIIRPALGSNGFRTYRYINPEGLSYFSLKALTILGLWVDTIVTTEESLQNVGNVIKPARNVNVRSNKFLILASKYHEL